MLWTLLPPIYTCLPPFSPLAIPLCCGWWCTANSVPTYYHPSCCLLRVWCYLFYSTICYSPTSVVWLCIHWFPTQCQFLAAYTGGLTLLTTSLPTPSLPVTAGEQGGRGTCEQAHAMHYTYCYFYLLHLVSSDFYTWVIVRYWHSPPTTFFFYLLVLCLMENLLLEAAGLYSHTLPLLPGIAVLPSMLSLPWAFILSGGCFFFYHFSIFSVLHWVVTLLFSMPPILYCVVRAAPLYYIALLPFSPAPFSHIFHSLLRKKRFPVHCFKTGTTVP